MSAGASAGKEEGVVRSIAPRVRAVTPAAVRVLVAVRFPGLPNVSDLEFDATWPAEEIRRWLTLARLVLDADGPVSAPAAPGALTPPPAAGPSRQPRPLRRPTTALSQPHTTATAAPDELLQWRRRAGLTQAQVAAAAGLSRSTVSLLERSRARASEGGASRARLTRTLTRLAPGPTTNAPEGGNR
jgi:hypothetical protein